MAYNGFLLEKTKRYVYVRNVQPILRCIKIHFGYTFIRKKILFSLQADDKRERSAEDNY